MKAIIQRVKRAEVRVEDSTTGAISQGLLVLLGVAPDDTEADMRWLIDKIVNLRIFANDEGKFDRSLLDVGGAILIVSQFTLFGDYRKGRRPNFDGAAPPALAENLYEQALRYCRELNISTQSGLFGAMMDVELINDGPVTLTLDSKDRR
ncbi:MAG: D-tyrosyl-tRNA(Tyr) deacylase [bacterium]|nr:D-tyrosyl-tRNA(Tyr) deacylase [bacterium]